MSLKHHHHHQQLCSKYPKSTKNRRGEDTSSSAFLIQIQNPVFLFIFLWICCTTVDLIQIDSLPYEIHSHTDRKHTQKRERGREREMGNSFGCSASGERLVSAARDGDLIEAKMLLDCNPCLAKYSTFGGLNSPLHFAAAKGHNEVLSLFHFPSFLYQLPINFLFSWLSFFFLFWVCVRLNRLWHCCLRMELM